MNSTSFLSQKQQLPLLVRPEKWKLDRIDYSFIVCVCDFASEQLVLVYLVCVYISYMSIRKKGLRALCISSHSVCSPIVQFLN